LLRGVVVYPLQGQPTPTDLVALRVLHSEPPPTRPRGTPDRSAVSANTRSPPRPSAATPSFPISTTTPRGSAQPRFAAASRATAATSAVTDCALGAANRLLVTSTFPRLSCLQPASLPCRSRCRRSRS